MGLLFDLPAINGNLEKSTLLKFRLWVADLNDVDVDNWPKAVNATISTNVLKAGKTFKYLDVKADSVKPNAAPGDSPFGGKLTLTPIFEGISKAALAWIYENAGKDVIVIWVRCSDNVRFIGGSPCSNGLRVKYTAIGAQDGGVNGIAMSFEGGECPEPFCFYEGEIPVEEPQALTVEDGEVTVNAKPAYILTDNAEDTALTGINGITDNDLGRVLEFRGAGVAHPTTISNSATFILSNGVAFNATVGASIFLLVGKSGANYTFTEVLRG